MSVFLGKVETNESIEELLQQVENIIYSNVFLSDELIEKYKKNKNIKNTLDLLHDEFADAIVRVDGVRYALKK